MRTILDLTDDASGGDGFAVPDPSSIYLDDDVVIALREVELRMTTPQFCTFVEALTAFQFRDFREVDVNDPDACPEREHHELRGLFKSMLGGTLGQVDVPEALSRELKWQFTAKRIMPERWRFLHYSLRERDAEIADLKAEIAETKKRRARGTRPTGPGAKSGEGGE